MTTAVIYTRTNEPTGDQLSDLHQLSACQRWAQEHDVVVVETFHDTEETTDGRAGVLARAEQDDVDHVLMYDMSRWSRKVAEVMQLEPVADKVVFARGGDGQPIPTAMGAFSLKTLIAVAQLQDLGEDWA